MSKRATSNKLDILADRLTREASARRPNFSEDLDERIRAAIGLHSTSNQLTSTTQNDFGTNARQKPDRRMSPDRFRAEPGPKSGSVWGFGLAASLCIVGAITIAWYAGSLGPSEEPNSPLGAVPTPLANQAQTKRAGAPRLDSDEQVRAVSKEDIFAGSDFLKSPDVANSAQRLASVPDWALDGVDRFTKSTVVTQPWADLDHDARLVTQMVIAPWPWYATE